MKNVGLKGRSPVQLQLKHTLHGHTDAVTCIAASAAFNIIVSGSKVGYFTLTGALHTICIYCMYVYINCTVFNLDMCPWGGKINNCRNLGGAYLAGWETDC